MARSGSSPPPIGLQALAERLLSPVTGIVRSVVFLPHSGDEIPMSYPAAVLPNYGRLPGMQDIDPTGGSGMDHTDALARILFETIERYCGAFVGHEDMLWARASSDAFLWGPRFPLYADFQYETEGWPFRRLTADSEIWWARGVSLLTGSEVFVPAVFVHVPYPPSSPDEWLGPSTSTGMAASWTWEGACLAGILEVCEREAFAVAWMNSLSMPRLRLHPATRLAQRLDSLLSFADAETSFVRLTNDLGIPTVACVLRYPYLGSPIVTIGASAKPSLEQACEKAFAEAANGYGRIVSQLERMAEEGGTWRPAPDYSNITDWEWHGLAYAYPELSDGLRFVTASAEEELVESDKAPPVDEATALRSYLYAHKDKFSDIVAVDLTTREFAELGVRVAKILIPQAVPLHPDHRFPWLGHQRLYEVPRLLGYTQSNTASGGLNPWPHPFS